MQRAIINYLLKNEREYKTRLEKTNKSNRKKIVTNNAKMH